MSWRVEWILVLVAVAWTTAVMRPTYQEEVPVVSSSSREQPERSAQPRDPFQDLTVTPTPTPTPECWKSWSDWTDEEWVQADRGGEPRKRAFPLLNDDDLPFTIHGVRPGLTSRQAVAVWGEGSLSMGGWGCQRSVESRPLLIVHAVVPSDPVVAVWGDQLEHHGQLLAWEGLSASELHGLLGAPARSGPHVTCGGRGNEEEWSYDLWHVVIDVLLVDGVVRSFTIRYRGVDYTGC